MGSGRYRALYWHLGVRHTAPHTFVTKTDGKMWLANVQAEIHRGTWLDPSKGAQTLSSYANSWLDGRTDLRPMTRTKYAHMLDRHVLPVLGSTELGRLSPSSIRAWYMKLRQEYVTTGDDAYRMLRACLNTAVADGVIARNPCQVRGAGTARTTERPVVSIPEVNAAVEVAPDRWRLAVLLAPWCQLRRGEIAGLQRRDVDLSAGTIKIRRSVVRPMRGEAIVGPTKTTAGNRTLAVPVNVLPALKDHLDRFVEPAPDAWLFTTTRGLPVKPERLDRVWESARKAIGRPEVTLHDLRHSGLTWAAASGASLAELMRRGGHSSAVAAMRYQHATDDRDRALADALANLATRANDSQLEPGQPRTNGARKSA